MDAILAELLESIDAESEELVLRLGIIRAAKLKLERLEQEILDKLERE